MGTDRMVQCSLKTGTFDHRKMRPAKLPAKPETWDALGFRKSPTVQPDGRVNSVNLSSSADGTGTYRVEIYRAGSKVTHFFLGVFPHPGSQSWGDVETSTKKQAKFLCNLAAGTPLQEHVIKINADDYE